MQNALRYPAIRLGLIAVVCLSATTARPGEPQPPPPVAELPRFDKRVEQAANAISYAGGEIERPAPDELRVSLKGALMVFDVKPDGRLLAFRRGVPKWKSVAADVDLLGSLGRISLLEITGTRTTDAIMIRVGRLKDLQRLWLRSSDVTDVGLAEVQNLRKLSELRLDDSRDITDAGLAAVSGLPALRVLSLTNTTVSDAGLVHLKNLPAIEELELRDCSITDKGLAHLRSLETLESISLAKTDVTDAGMEALAALTRLSSLDLSGTKVEAAGLEKLAALVNLAVIDLESAPVTNAGAAHLTQFGKLEFLNLAGTQVDDGSIASLSRLSKLETLRLPHRVTAAGLQRLRQALPGCRIYHEVRDATSASVVEYAGRQ